MLITRKSLVCLGSISLSSTLHSGAVEEAILQVTVIPGALEIAPNSVNGPFTPANGAVSVMGTDQVDAVIFEIPSIQINDLNGDGLGWKLTAAPTALSDGAHTLPVGTVDGFSNPSDVTSSSIQSPNTVLFASGDGVANYTIDYRVAYTVPASAASGDYSGAIIFTIVAE